MVIDQYKEQVPQRPNPDQINAKAEQVKSVLTKHDNEPDEKIRPLLQATSKDAYRIRVEALREHALGISNDRAMDGWEPDDYVALLTELGEDISDIDERRAEVEKTKQEEQKEKMDALLGDVESLVGVDNNENTLQDFTAVTDKMSESDDITDVVVRSLSEGGAIYEKNPQDATTLLGELLKISSRT